MFNLFILAAAIQLAYALYFFIRIIAARDGEPTPVQERKPVSIIICARNEAANLKKNLPLVLAQKYTNAAGKPNYEVIVVNDASTDDTAKVLQELELQYGNLWDVVIAPDADRNFQGKKFALSRGIAIAANEWLLLTDADCTPVGDRWLELMASPLAQGKEIVAGYGGYSRTGGGGLNAFVRWETMHTFLQYSTYALAGKPYMAVGRNLACTKNILEKAQQGEIWNALPSGDDDLLVSIAGNKDNIAIVFNNASFTYSDTKATWREWVKQKQRHLSTGKYYKRDIKLLLGTYATAHAVLWLCFFMLLFTPLWKLVSIIMGLRSVIYWLVWMGAAIKLREKNLIFLFPPFDFGWMIYNFAFLPYIAWKNKKHWK